MASSRVLEREVQEQPRRAAAASLDLCAHKYSLLVVIGRTAHPRQTGHISREIERGIRSWNVDLESCDLNLYLRQFLSYHTASFKGVGHKCLRHSTRVLDAQVLICPSQDQVHSEVRALLSHDSAHKLLILAGESLEESGDLLFHRGVFSSKHLKQILTELFIDPEIFSSKLSLTISCPNIGLWRETLLGNRPLCDALTLHVNPPEVLPVMEPVGEFTSLITGTISPLSPFDLLPPPTTVGFLKLSRPCCYVFPAGRGDCAFFAVNGFTMLMDGGSDSQACFWKLVRHLDRIDAVLLTHVGTENLPGVNAFLERKVAELELSSDVKDDSSKRLISPELGVAFFNAPNRLQIEKQDYADSVLKSTQQAALTLQLLKKLDIKPQPLFRPQGTPIEPITLFQKMGVGQLDLYILSPGKKSQEYQTFLEDWPDGVSSLPKDQSLPLTALTSVSVLLVWHPACPQEKVVRMLFPGVTPQAKLLQGLENLKGLAFLQKPTVTTGDLQRLGEDRKTKRTDSIDSGLSQGRDTSSKPGRDLGGKDDVKNVLMREKGKAENGVTTKEAGKNRTREAGVKQRASEKNSSRKAGSKKEEKTGNKEESITVRNEQFKKDAPTPKLKNENKPKLKKEATKAPVKKTRKPQGKDVSNGSKGERTIASQPNTEARKKDTLEPPELHKEPQARNSKQEPEEKPCGSRMSTPEDMTADFLRLQRESAAKETAAIEKQKMGELEKDSIQVASEKAPGAHREAAGGDDGAQIQAFSGKDLRKDQKPGNSNKPAKVVGFPSSFNSPPKNDSTVQLDLTPTEFTLLDGALRYSPSSRPSPENQVALSPDEQTVEPDSPDSRPNSAGHTPYCLSPDDVWSNRDTLSRLEQIADPEGPDVNQEGALPKLNEDQPCQPTTAQEGHANVREKQLSFLSLGAFKEGSDPLPSVATTTTTHSMPAEVSSPQSTEVDESLSMSLEQGPTTGSQREGDDNLCHSNSNGAHFVGMSLPVRKPSRSLGQGPETGRPPAPSTLHFEGTSHEVDLCLVSPCEFKHFKPADSGLTESSRGLFAPHNHGKNAKDMSPSESNTPACTEDCPSTTADGALDSDSDESGSEPTNSPRDLHSNQALHQDPPPAPLRDSPPLPPHPDACMPVPQSDSGNHGKRTKASGLRGKKSTVPPQIMSSGINRPGNQSGATKGKGSSPRAPSSSTRTAPANHPASKSTSDEGVTIYVDLAYIPSGVSSSTVSVDFFRRIRSSSYIVSGDSPEREELLARTLNALLDSKTFWPDGTQVTVIPTYESAQMQEWYQQTVDRQKELGIAVLGSNSTVAMQDETFPACKIEF